MTKYGANWLNNGWPTWTLSPVDFYRIIGYRQAKKMVNKGIMRRMKPEVFVEGESDTFAEWFI